MTGSKRLKTETWGSLDGFFVEPYKSKWNIIFCDDLDKHLKELLRANRFSEEQINQYVISENGQSVNGCVFRVDERDWYLCMFDITRFSVGVAVHEAFHMTKMILYPRGMSLDSSVSSEEPYAYLLDHITTRIMDIHKVAQKDYRQYIKDKKDGKTSTNN